MLKFKNGRHSKPAQAEFLNACQVFLVNDLLNLVSITIVTGW